MNPMDYSNYKLISIYKRNKIYTFFGILLHFILLFAFSLLIQTDLSSANPVLSVLAFLIFCMPIIIVYNIGKIITKHFLFKKNKLSSYSNFFQSIVEIYPKDFITKRLYFISEFIYYPIFLFIYELTILFLDINFGERNIYLYMPLIYVLSCIITFKIPIFLKVLVQPKSTIFKIKRDRLEIYSK